MRSRGCVEAAHFDLPLRFTARIVAARERLTSPNLIAKLPGRDRKLASQYVAISAHLDHLGIGAPINGDKIYHGAMDDASGVATVLDIADRLKKGTRPRRSILIRRGHGRRNGSARIPLLCRAPICACIEHRRRL